MPAELSPVTPHGHRSSDRLDNSLSWYLDLWRIIAAFLVFTMHLFLPQLNIYPLPGDGTSPFLHGQGHLAVIVFFVLSGYLISHSAHRNGMTLRRFALDRSVRLCAVIIPSLLLTAAVSWAAPRFSPHWASGFLSEPWQPVRYLLNGLNCQQLWFLCVAPGVNWAFWSLGYEAWFYVLLALVVFLRGRRRVAALSLALLVVGPKILLLLPAWLFGVAAERLTVLERGAKGAGMVWKLGFLLSLLLVLAALASPGSLPWWNHGSSFGHRPWFYSANASADCLFALLVAVNFLCAGMSGSSLPSIPTQWEPPVRWVAKRTYSLYLYHTPLLFLGGWLLPLRRHDAWVGGGLATAVLGVTALLARFTECRTPDLKRLIARRIFPEGSPP